MKYFLIDEDDRICGEFSSPVAAELYRKELERKEVIVRVVPEEK